MKKRNVLVCLTALAVSTFLGGCGGPEGPVPSKGDVAKYVKENISEKCEYVSRETVSESPKEIAYTFKSKERDLEFKVYAYRHNVGMYEMKIYKGKIRTDYEYVVRTSYDSRIQPLFEEFISDGDVKIASSDQVDKLAEAFVKANEIYREELQYNDKSFLEEHPYDNIRVVCDTAPGSTYKTYGLGYFAINGVEYDEEYYKNALDNGIAQAIKDGKISGEQYQGYEDAIEDIHVSQLDHIYLNDEEMLYDNNQNDYGTVGVMTEKYAYSEYNYDENSYMMFVDYGLVADGIGSPAFVIREYTDRLGGSFEILTKDQTTKDQDLECTWTIGDHKYVMTCHYNEMNVTNLKVTCDGEDLHIGNNHKPENDFRVTMVTLEDFCKLLDLNYRIDEESGSLYLYSN